MRIFDIENWLWKSNFGTFWHPPLHQFSKFNNFLWVGWFLGKKLSNFVPPAWKLDNLYYNIIHLQFLCFHKCECSLFWKLQSKSFFFCRRTYFLSARKSVRRKFQPSTNLSTNHITAVGLFCDWIKNEFNVGIPPDWQLTCKSTFACY